ncbi:MAG: rolling circle replication-associated protein [Phycisphaerae bacterium]
MIEIRARNSRSWMDARYGRMLANQVAGALVERCAGEKVLKMELTYERSGYANPQELFDKASEDRHVRRFMESLGNFLGCNLTGKWLCKMEFQQGGWVHWHIILLGFEYLDHADLTRLWGHGFVWVRKAVERDLRYTCKYFSKDGAIPAFLYLRPIRSVKFIRASPGFWAKEHVPVSTEEQSGRNDWDAEPEPLRLPIYTSIGQMIENGEGATVCRDQDGRYAQIRVPFWLVVPILKARGVRVVGSVNGWMQFRLRGVSDLLANVKDPAGFT